MKIADTIQDVRLKVKAAAERVGRKAEDIRIVAVTKTVSEDRMKDAYAQGLKVFGENRIQEWQKKQGILPEDCEWHVIGRLQTNKVKYLNQRIALIHSLDRLALMEKLNEAGENHQVIWPTLIQVNVALDEAKAGLEAEEVKDFLITAREYPFIRVLGLMTIGAYDVDLQATRSYFRKLRELRDSLVSQGLRSGEELHHLSMGMSQDYEIAIEEGATIIRIGSVIFGQRN